MNTEIIRSKINDRNIYILLDGKNDIIELNFMQGYDDLPALIKVNDKKVLDFYNKFKENPLFKGLDRIKKINQILWLYLDIIDQ